MDTLAVARIVRRRSGWIVKTQGMGRVIWKIVYFDVDGRRRKESTDAATKQVARRILSERTDAVERARLMRLSSVNELVAPAPITVRFFSKDYLDHARGYCTKETVRRYESQFKTYLLPALGSLSLREVTGGQIQRYADARLGGKSRERGGKRAEVDRRPRPATVRQELMTLSGLFREAVKRGFVDKNPVRLVKKPRVENTIVRFLDVEEEGQLLAFATEPLRSAIIVSIHSGLREGELTRLTWADVHFGASHVDSHIVVRHTKSKRDRAVPMSETLHAELKRQPRKLVKGEPSPYVFSNSDGTHFERFNADGWRAVLKRAGIRNFRWHDLRHTFASRLAQRGVPITAIKELLGHSTVTVTMRYAHLGPNDLRTAVRALDLGTEKAESATRSATQQHSEKSAAS